MSGLDELVTGPVARDVLALLVRALTVHVRRNGGMAPGWAEPVLRALAEAADAPAPPLGSVGGTAVGTVGRVEAVMVETSTAADLVGRSPEYVRRLCRHGRVRCRRVGRHWLVDPQSLASVLERSAA